MTTAPREARVLDAVVTLVDSLLENFDVVELLTDLAERCTSLLDVAAAGILLAEPQGPLHLLAATSEDAYAAEDAAARELFQLQADEGPCLDSYTGGSTVAVADLDSHRDRWPQFGPVALEAGYTAVHAVPLTAAGTVLGAIGLFGDVPLSDEDLLAGKALARVATVAILQHRAPTSESVRPALRTVLADRVVVEQAKGFVRERLDVTINEAFDLLREYARRNSAHLTATARSLLADPDARALILAGLAALHEGYDR